MITEVGDGANTLFWKDKWLAEKIPKILRLMSLPWYLKELQQDVQFWRPKSMKDGLRIFKVQFLQKL
jgi:hypothetical protein